MSFRLVPKSVTLNGEIAEMALMLHYFFIVLNPRRAVFLAIAQLLFSNLHTAVARILSISSTFFFLFGFGRSIGLILAFNIYLRIIMIK